MKKFIRRLAAALKATLVVLMILVIIGSGLLLWLSFVMISGNGSGSNPVAQLLEPLFPQDQPPETTPPPTTEPTEPETTEPPTTLPPEPDR